MPSTSVLLPSMHLHRAVGVRDDARRRRAARAGRPRGRAGRAGRRRSCRPTSDATMRAFSAAIWSASPLMRRDRVLEAASPCWSRRSVRRASKPLSIARDVAVRAAARRCAPRCSWAASRGRTTTTRTRPSPRRAPSSDGSPRMPSTLDSRSSAQLATTRRATTHCGTRRRAARRARGVTSTMATPVPTLPYEKCCRERRAELHALARVARASRRSRCCARSSG